MRIQNQTRPRSERPSLGFRRSRGGLGVRARRQRRAGRARTTPRGKKEERVEVERDIHFAMETSRDRELSAAANFFFYLQRGSNPQSFDHFSHLDVGLDGSFRSSAEQKGFDATIADFKKYILFHLLELIDRHPH
jgi:hypothetical protein